MVEVSKGFAKEYAQMTSIREEIIKRMNWSHVTFYKKMNGDIALRASEKEVLKSIFSKYNIELQ